MNRNIQKAKDSICSVVEQEFVNIFREMGEIIEGHEAPADCLKLSCSRRMECRNIVEYTVKVLEETRHSFKSPVLKQLRLRLESFIDKIPKEDIEP